jgi:hypothetical protein
MSADISKLNINRLIVRPTASGAAVMHVNHNLTGARYGTKHESGPPQWS